MTPHPKAALGNEPESPGLGSPTAPAHPSSRGTQSRKAGGSGAAINSLKQWRPGLPRSSANAGEQPHQVAARRPDFTLDLPGLYTLCSPGPAPTPLASGAQTRSGLTAGSPVAPPHPQLTIETNRDTRPRTHPAGEGRRPARPP